MNGNLNISIVDGRRGRVVMRDFYPLSAQIAVDQLNVVDTLRTANWLATTRARGIASGKFGPAFDHQIAGAIDVPFSDPSVSAPAA